MSLFSETEHLLEKVNIISQKHDEIEKITGESYNIFKLLNLSSKEVGLHSLFISDLLNPEGTHNCGPVFLEYFISQQKEKCKQEENFNKLNSFNINECNVITEKHLGYINIDKTEGGYIDIILRDNLQNHIIIENKIYAGDQTNQLVRYKNYDRKAPIFYLTLDGKKPDVESSGHLEIDVDFICLSYKSDITQWIELCIKETYKKPLLRETLRQYLNIVKELTGQNANNIMEKELIALLTSNSLNVKAMFHISESITDARLSLIQKFAAALKEAYDRKPKSGFTITIEDGYGLANAELVFNSPKHNHSINLYFANDLWNPTIGIAEIHNKNYLDKDLIEALSDIKLGKNEKNWGNGWVWVNRYEMLNDYFLSVDKWSKIADGEFTIIDNVLDVAYRLIDIIVNTEKIETS